MIVDFTKINPMHDTDVSWQCYRSCNTKLVYFIHNKCASTLYETLFLKLKWSPSGTQEIDWNTDVVFSHIKDPMVKHRKGLTEAIFSFFPKMKTALSTPDGLKFLANITSIEPHSYTIYRMLGSNALKLNWIPIDTELDHKVRTLNFIVQHGEPVTQADNDWFLNLPKQKQSTDEEVEFFNNLIAITSPPEIIRYIDFDKCLYDAVTKKIGFEPDNFKLRVTELEGTGLSNLEAQKLADAEVASGEYLNWFKND